MDYRAEIKAIENSLKNGATGKAGSRLADLWNRTLKAVYKDSRMNAKPSDIRRFMAVEEEIAGPDGSFADLDLARMVDLYRRGAVAELAAAHGGKRTYSAGFAFEMLVEMVQAAEKEGRAGEEEVELWIANLKLFLREAGRGLDPEKGATTPGPMEADEKTCPRCHEPVRAGWAFCPGCECVLDEKRCAECGLPISPSWKRCPECGRSLSQTGKTQPEALVEPIAEMAFVFVPGGEFAMGDETGEGAAGETPVHRVELAGFYMGIHAVTQKQWRKVMGANPSKFQSGDDYPVEQVAFDDVKAFIRRLEEENGGAFRFRLPTEAEWEYAARGGGKKELYAGGNDPDAVAWFNENSHDSTRPVGRKRPNSLGLYDMSGNVWEWCEDVFTEDAYQIHAYKNPLVVAGGEDRVIRGGNWRLDAWSCRCARRFGMAPEYSGSGLGFRLVAEKV